MAASSNWASPQPGRSLTTIVALAGVLLLGVPCAFAHSAPGSAVMLDFRSAQVDAELHIPLSELKYAFGQDVESDPAAVVKEFGPLLGDYLRRHITVRAPDGRVWDVNVGRMHVTLQEQPIDLVVLTHWQPPADASLRQFTLLYDVVSHEVMNHVVLVSLRSDWHRSMFGDQPQLLGTLRSFEKELLVDRTAGSPWHGFRDLLKLGMHHIGEGTDHLMFLLALLLPAPLLAGGRRWDRRASTKETATRLLKIVTAFTVGHSLTLICAGVGWLRMPSQPIEILIAISIFVSALHAIRPIFVGREPLIALVFGLVHGLAFATVLTAFHFDAWQFAAALFAFNVGIELMQLLVVLLTVPWLLLLSRTPAYATVRVAGALFAGAAALGWMGERTLNWPNPLNTVVDAIAIHAMESLAILAAMAVIAWIWSRRQTADTNRA
ncbi:MAG: HupE/UreJ family protein [Opitutaceae bacterium]|nr:HupE/UreJ family protein [Opitutaceae bacterium]